jgi:glyceraldehyde 3-phosphate dehydrogenase (phosphorylating)
MAIKVGINGFGRIGRQVLRIAKEQKADIDFVGINDLTSPETLAHLFKYDSVHGVFKGEVKVDGRKLIIDGDAIEIFEERDPAKLTWGKLGAEIILESTGIFRKHEQASKHITAGAKKVIISAPAPDPDFTLAMGINDKDYDPAKHNIISNASCTTNCLAPVAKVLDELADIQSGIMTTIHSYTNDQSILDMPHKDLRRARAAAVSMIPTSTGAAKAIGLVYPKLLGKMTGFAIRVPTPNVSVVDLTCLVAKEVTPDAINAAMRKAAAGPLKGILAISEDPCVSSDFNGNPASSILDPEYTLVLGKQVKLLSWYDNEWGYSSRCVDLIEYLAAKN